MRHDLLDAEDSNEDIPLVLQTRTPSAIHRGHAPKAAKKIPEVEVVADSDLEDDRAHDSDDLEAENGAEWDSGSINSESDDDLPEDFIRLAKSLQDEVSTH